MRQTILVILFFLTMVCQSQTTENKWVKLKEFARDYYKNDILKKDPLITLDGKAIGLLSEIDLNDFRFNPVQTSSLDIIPKGSEYFKSIWGQKAENGVINIRRHFTLYCGTNKPKTIILVDDKETNYEVFQKLLKQDEILNWIEIPTVIDREESTLSLIILTTKKGTE